VAQNIEIKARAHDFIHQRSLAEGLSDAPCATLIQEDTFFVTPQGRLKLREFPDAPTQLIYYNRVDSQGPKLSEYFITETHDGPGLKLVLEKTYGVRQIVKKVRALYMSGRTRLHFDDVEGLGEFIELEVVLADNDCLEEGQKEASELMSSLNIANDDLIGVAYADLLDQA
jgi:predicted adenylyl cyclase CyaB